MWARPWVALVHPAGRSHCIKQMPHNICKNFAHNLAWLCLQGYAVGLSCMASQPMPTPHSTQTMAVGAGVETERRPAAGHCLPGRFTLLCALVSTTGHEWFVAQPTDCCGLHYAYTACTGWFMALFKYTIILFYSTWERTITSFVMRSS